MGTTGALFAATFGGDGRMVRHLYIDGGARAGLFGVTGSPNIVRYVGAVEAVVAGTTRRGSTLSGLRSAPYVHPTRATVASMEVDL